VRAELKSGASTLLAIAIVAGACGPAAAPGATTASQAPAASQAPQLRPGEVYKVGLSAAITGPVASTYGPSYEGFKAYIDRLNERGGIDGRVVEIVALDDRSEPPRATTNAKRLVEEEKVLLLLSNSSSATYAPMIGAAKGGSTPLLFMGSAVCPGDVLPPRPDPLLFCASFNILTADAGAMVKAIGDLKGSRELKLGLVAMDIPVSKQGVDLIETQAKAAGMEVVSKFATPPTTTEYTPFATRLSDAKATFAAHWAPLEVGIGMFGALSKIGWPGLYVAVASPTAEQEVARFKQQNFYVMPSYSFAVDGLPLFKDIEAAGKKSGVSSPADALSIGWVGGAAVEAALRQCGWPCDKVKLRDAMEKVKVETGGIFGGPIDWSPGNHVRSAAFYRVYRWDGSKVALVKDWFKIDIK